MDDEHQVTAQERRRQQHLRRSQTEDQPAHGPDLPWAHFQAHGEQEQRHAKLCDALQLFNRMHRHGAWSMGSDDDPGNDETQV